MVNKITRQLITFKDDFTKQFNVLIKYWDGPQKSITETYFQWGPQI